MCNVRKLNVAQLLQLIDNMTVCEGDTPESLNKFTLYICIVEFVLR